jgi:hypothetical protein
MKWLGRRLRGGSEPKPPDPDPTFLALLAEGGLAAWDRQLAFAAVVGDRDWLLDQDLRVLKLGDDLWLPASLLGTVSDGAATWLWAWANPTIEPDMRTDAERARSIGTDRGIDLLTDPEVDIGRIVDGHLLALAASGLLDADAYYRCPYRGGAAYVTVRLSTVRGPYAAPGRRVGEVLRRAVIDMPYVVSHPSVEAYLAQIGASATVNDGTIEVTDGPTLTFDDLGRLTALEETLD